MQCDLDTSIPEWIVEYPQTAPVFQQFGLDTSCAGKSLEYVCTQSGLSPRNVLRVLTEVIAATENQRLP